ncbi:uncharacterized protein LOC135827025 [Sycon ciliatum]|uniref:uncharacterized protein LOC135827025 n=1 Tax=Sycon ciliatum TaxID=27933 RepID=UPI0031F6B018
MACEDRGTRLMTMDEVLEIKNFILENNLTIADGSIWVLNPVSRAPIAFNMKANTQNIRASTAAHVLCKSSTKLEKKASCWTADKFLLYPTQTLQDYSTYYAAIHNCEHPKEINAIIPLPYLHYCLDSLTRYTGTYDSYWILHQGPDDPFRASDLQTHPTTQTRRNICLQSEYIFAIRL